LNWQNLGHSDRKTTQGYIGTLGAELRKPPAVYDFRFKQVISGGDVGLAKAAFHTAWIVSQFRIGVLRDAVVRTKRGFCEVSK
jgi:hypothetical protein